MRHLSIRHVPPNLASALDAEQRRRGTSLNRTVLDLLAQALGLDPEKKTNGLEAFAGTWTQEEFDEFEAAVQFTEQIDEELWR